MLDRVRELNRRINELERQITPLIRELAPTLLSIPGCGALTAAKLVGETAGARRFRSKSAYARWNGTAPQPASSGNTTRFRLNRGGNRQVNAALHRIALTQARAWPQGRDYITKRLRQGNTKAEALRLLRRRLSDVVYRTLLIDELAAQPGTSHPHPPRLDIGARYDSDVAATVCAPGCAVCGHASTRVRSNLALDLRSRDEAQDLNLRSKVGETGFEPATARPPAGCATRLRHSPYVLQSGRRESNPP